MDFCCGACFGDPYMRDQIAYLSAKKHDKSSGKCAFCSAEGTVLVDPSELRDYVDPVASLYHPEASGHVLAHFMREDWGLFQSLSEKELSVLLAAILEDTSVIKTGVAFSGESSATSWPEWDSLGEEIRHGNRWFFDERLDRSQLATAFGRIESDRPNDEWYRARVVSGAERLENSIFPMSAPPANLATSGRANPAGISYLYLASDLETACAEVRPLPGQNVTVAKFAVGAMRLVNLADFSMSVSPFNNNGPADIISLRGFLKLFNWLSEELSLPVDPLASSFQYAPSQYFCECMKFNGFDGVLYRSSVSSGTNLALFDPAKAVEESRWERKVTGLSINVDSAQEFAISKQS